jgi:hypothetical protein
VVLLPGGGQRAQREVLRELPAGVPAEGAGRPRLLLDPLRPQQPRQLPGRPRGTPPQVLRPPPSYLVKDKWRRINSVEYFKRGIEPKWEDPQNAKGGRFVFPVNKTQENREELYTNLVFFLLGEDYEHAGHVCGFRFISPKNNQSFYRVEIWVDFCDENMELLKHYQQLLTDLFKTLAFDSKSVRYLNNRAGDQPSKEGAKEAK